MSSARMQDDLSVQAEIVDAALAAEDFAPLVRLVFDAFSASLNANTTKESLLTRPTSNNYANAKGTEGHAGESAAAGRRASDRTKVLRKQAAAPVIAALEQVLDSKSTELSQICRGNAEEIVSSLQELEAMRNIGENLRDRIKEGDVSTREAGGKFLISLEQLQELTRVANAVASSCQAVGACKQLLSLCTQAGRAVNSNELFKAYCHLQRAELEFLGGSSDSISLETAEEDNQKLSRTVRLHHFLTSKVLEMQTAMQEKAISDFNNWLVSVRREAKSVGRSALKRAAWFRNRQESLLVQRRTLANELMNVIDVEAFAGTLAKPLPQLSAGSTKLDPKTHPAAVDLLGDGEVDPSEDLMLKIDMTPLHRCLQVHSCLGRLSTFKDYYQSNRRTQLNNDLAANMNFAQQYQSYIAQVTGYFVIEDRVARATDAMSGQIDAGWETAIAFMKPALESAFQTQTNIATFISIKDVMLLACSSLGACGYHVAPLRDLLLNGKSMYCEVLFRQIDHEHRDTVRLFGRTAYEVLEANQAAEVSGTLGLPLFALRHHHDGLGPTPPFTAPFSQMLPKILWRTRLYVTEVASYCWGLMSSAEMISFVRLQRDTMLVNSFLAAVSASIEQIPVADPNALYFALQALSDLRIFSEALQSLDNFTFITIRGIPPSRETKVGHRLGSTALSCQTASTREASLMTPSLASDHSHQGHKHHCTVRAHQTCLPGLLTNLTELEGFCEQKMLDILSWQVIDIVKRYDYEDWEPELPISHAGQHSELFIQLEALFKESTAQIHQYMWDEEYKAMASKLVKLIASTLLGMLLRDEVEAFNIYAVFALTDDALALAEAANKTKIPNIADGVSELLQICDVLATGRIEEMLDEDRRKENYPAIKFKTLQIILKKFREVRQKSGKTKQPESFLKRRAVEKVMKMLKF